MKDWDVTLTFAKKLNLRLVFRSSLVHTSSLAKVKLESLWDWTNGAPPVVVVPDISLLHFTKLKKSFYFTK